jgi:hypothetical protein
MNTYSEIQKFKIKWVWVGVLALNVLFIYALIQQLLLGKPFGPTPASDVILILCEVLALLLLFFILSIRLKTSFDERGIQYRFYPFQLKTTFIAWNELHDAHLRQYNSFYEYGGWGIRYGTPKIGNAVNTSESGNIGLQLHFKNGRLLLIGTKNPEKLQEILNNYFKKSF